MGGMVTYAHRLIESIVRIVPDVRLTVLCAAGEQASFAGHDWSSEVHVVTHRLLGRRYIGRLRGRTRCPHRAGAGSRPDPQPGHDRPATLSCRPRRHRPRPHLARASFLGSARDNDLEVCRSARCAGRRPCHHFLVASRDDIAHRLRVPVDRIDVIPLAASGVEASAAVPEADLRERFGLGAAPVVLSVSSLRAHKNLTRLVQAMGRVARTSPSPSSSCPACVGRDRRRWSAWARASGTALELPGWVSGAELEGLYATAACVVQPAMQEGFGLPVLEAMQRGVPVACSNRSSLPEVAGAAAAYFDPFDVGGMADAIGEVLRGGEAVAERVRIRVGAG